MNTGPDIRDLSGEQLSSRAVARQALSAVVPQRAPVLDDLDAAIFYQPCERLSGVMLDIMELPDGRLALSMFECRDEGVVAGMQALLAEVISTRHMLSGAQPHTVVSYVTAELARRQGAHRSVAAFVGYFDTHDNVLTCCATGGPHALVYQHAERRTGPLAGALPEGAVLQDTRVLLERGDWLVLHTRGVFALYDGTADDQARERLLGDLRPLFQTGAPTGLTALLRDRCDRRGGSELGDDVGAIALRVPADSRRSQLHEELGFAPADPVYLMHIRYFEEIDQAAAAVLRSMDRHGYRDDAIRTMKMALAELMVNALEHGNRRDPTRKVTIGHTVDGARAVVAIMDEGAGFDPAALPDPTLPENLEKDRGRGVYLVRRLVDEMRHNAAGNRVTVVKNYRPL
jgi:serine/threonine-protein kinase RsbW